MDMIEAYRTCIKKYATFQGRARRSEYWLFTLCNSLISLLLSGISYFAQSSDSQNLMMGLGIVSIVYALFVFLPGLAVSVRRLHDSGHSGWFYFIILIPIIGPIVLLVNLCKDSVPGTNEYGRNPKDREVISGGIGGTIPNISEGNREGIMTDGVHYETVKVQDRGYETVSIKPVLKVTCTRGPIVGTSVVGEAIYVGRDPKLCQLAFPEDTPGVSKVHCMLHTNGRAIEIRDLGSSFGTFLSDKTRLKPNETVRFADGGNARANKPSTNTVYIGSENVTISVELSTPYPM